MTGASDDRPATTFPADLGLAPDDAHNRRLVASVHPADWRNPEPAPRYNLVVVGGGTAGLVSAAGAAGLGAKVALVERRLLGGDCLNVGCVPSKTLLRAAAAAAAARPSGRLGVRAGGEPVVDFAAVMERVRAVRADIAPHDSAERFARHYGVDVFLGDGRFVARDAVEVGGARLRFARAVIATGARAAVPPIPGLVEAGYLTNETVFNLTRLPARLAVIGGGPIGCELAQAFARLGARVTIVEQADRLLPRDDPGAATLLRAALERDGVEVRLGAKVERVGSRAAGRELELSSAAGRTALAVEAILVAVGRVANVDGLGLEAAGVRFGRGGVEVDDGFRTANRRVFAAGDVASRYQFTHAADAAARAVIQNALLPFAGRRRASRLTIPWCTFTDPEVAGVGLTAAEAAERGVEVDAFTVPMAEVDRAIADGETDGFVQIRVRRGGDAIVGASIVGRHAGELISEVTLAMTAGVGLGRLASVVHPYPTRAEAIRKAGDAYNRTRLTPRAATLLRRFFALTR